MGVAILGPKLTRKIAASTGLDVVRAWGRGAVHDFWFVTADHRHGWWNRKTGEWKYHDDKDVIHMTSCSELFPGYRDQGGET